MILCHSALGRALYARLLPPLSPGHSPFGPFPWPRSSGAFPAMIRRDFTATPKTKASTHHWTPSALDSPHINGRSATFRYMVLCVARGGDDMFALVDPESTRSGARGARRLTTCFTEIRATMPDKGGTPLLAPHYSSASSTCMMRTWPHASYPTHILLLLGWWRRGRWVARRPDPPGL